MDSDTPVTRDRKCRLARLPSHPPFGLEPSPCRRDDVDTTGIGERHEVVLNTFAVCFVRVIHLSQPLS